MTLHTAPLMTPHYHLTDAERAVCEAERADLTYRLNTYSRNESEA